MRECTLRATSAEESPCLTRTVSLVSEMGTVMEWMSKLRLCANDELRLTWCDWLQTKCTVKGRGAIRLD
jgi:hypothetical protein